MVDERQKDKLAAVERLQLRTQVVLNSADEITKEGRAVLLALNVHSLVPRTGSPTEAQPIGTLIDRIDNDRRSRYGIMDEVTEPAGLEVMHMADIGVWDDGAMEARNRVRIRLAVEQGQRALDHATDEYRLGDVLGMGKTVLERSADLDVYAAPIPIYLDRNAAGDLVPVR
jgi:hypothetical protein